MENAKPKTLEGIFWTPAKVSLIPGTSVIQSALLGVDVAPFDFLVNSNGRTLTGFLHSWNI
jgi:hypothetical protein